MDDKLFELITKMYNEIQDIKQTISHIESTMVTKQDLEQLEHRANNKTSALFDAQEIQLNKSIDISLKLVDLDGKLDKLVLKLIKHSL